ncbi:unnamed protein product [Brassica rapa]|uniref:Uncharacterized protein n=1 Tax=Brassica campestris TaxID=3711 RepID=A0A3P5YRH6_BRACM|nr:unnamed protein product [Brassica rapa]VDC63983.1 unnamed protein product [Brassica rapa]
MIKRLSNMDYNQKRERCGQYMEALEEERARFMSSNVNSLFA